MVPTHGDWQPRNWLMHDGTVSIIDFGRADLRPALTDFARLAAQQFRKNAPIEAAFLKGYGPDPRASAAWQRNMIREAIGTAVWAFQVGNQPLRTAGSPDDCRHSCRTCFAMPGTHVTGGVPRALIGVTGN